MCVAIICKLMYSGMLLTLSPMMVAPVCSVGDPLQITCTASEEFIRWSILHLNEQGIREEITNSVQINSRSRDANVQTQLALV